MSKLNLVHLILIGTILYQTMFMLVQWWVYKRQEYLYYIAYIVSVLFFLVFRIDTAENFLPVHYVGMANEYVDQPVIIFAFWMYIRFGYYFLNLKSEQPKVYKAAIRLEWFFVGFIIVKCFTIPIGLTYAQSAYLYTVCTFVLFLVSIPVIVRLLRQRNLLNNFLVMGSLCITIGGVSGPVVALFLPDMGQNNMLVYLGLELSILVELLLLNTGLVVKNKLIQKQVIESQQRYIEQLQQTSALRTSLSTMQSKLSSDLHDNIGSGLSSISLYSEVARQKMLTNPNAAILVLNKITDTAIEVLAEMKDTIWFIQPKHNCFEDVITRLRHFAEPICMEKGILFSVTDECRERLDGLSLFQRKHIYLFLKETVNNALKYAGATNIDIVIQERQGFVHINITDNGAGIQTAHTGNGLTNLQNRASELQGHCNISSNIGQGVMASLKFPLTIIGDVA